METTLMSMLVPIIVKSLAAETVSFGRGSKNATTPMMSTPMTAETRVLLLDVGMV